MEHTLQASSEIRKALKQTVQLDNGKYGYVFSENSPIGVDPKWTCHVCNRDIVSERAMHMHLSHPLHNSKLLIPYHPHAQFKKFSEKKEEKENMEIITDVVPGEPVPPGMEDVVEVVCQIQAAFDSYTAGPLIGLEYIVELVSTEEECEPRYICLLCEKKGDPRSVMVHVTSQNHYLKYISCFFRTAGNALNMIPRNLETRKGIAIAVTKVSAEIEKHYGRLKPTSAEMETFMSKKYEILRQIDEKQHFRETPSTTFAHLVTISKIKEYATLTEDLRVCNYQFSKKDMLPKEENQCEERNAASDNNDDKRMRDKFSCNSEEGDSKILNKNCDDGRRNKIIDERIVIDNDIIVVSDDKPNSSLEVKSLSSISSLPNSQSRSRSRSNSKFQYRSRGRRRSRSSSLSRSSRSRRRRRSRSISRTHYSRRSRRSRSKERYRRRSPVSYRRGSPQLPYTRPHRSYSRSRSRERRRDSTSRDFPQRGYRSYNRYRHDKMYDDPPDMYGSMVRDDYRRKLSPRNDRLSRSRERSISHGDRSDLKLRRDDNYSRSSSNSRKNEEDCVRKAEEEKEKRLKWNQFQEELNKLEEEMEEKLKFYKTRPEKHPMYPEVWKGFWNCRYKELQQAGKDPTKHDFKPEWIVFWEKKMKELHEEEVAGRKEELRQKLNVKSLGRNRNAGDDLQDISPPTPEGARDVTVDDIKNTWKALTGSEIKAPRSKRSISPWEGSGSPPRKSISPPHPSIRSTRDTGRKFYEIAPPIVHCLRMLSVLENQLGSLGPKVLDLLSKALILEKSKPSQSMTLLQNRDIHILFETIKEKIRGQLLAGIVMRNLVPATRAVIKSIDNMLASNPLNREVFIPVKVPGVGMVDKVAVAQQIAAALVAQGKTDVSQQELEELINAVVGMAQASNTNPTQDMSSATFFSQLDIQKSTGSSHINQIISNMITAAQKSLGYSTESQHVVQPPLLQLVYQPPSSNLLAQNLSSINILNSGQQYRGIEVPKAVESGNPVSDSELKERLSKFKELPPEEQQSLIALLKELESTQPERVEKLREFVAGSLAPVAPKPVPKPIGLSKPDRLSPFSMRSGGANPSPERNFGIASGERTKKFEASDDDDDDDYSFEDVYNAASEKLRIKQLEEDKRKEEEEKKANKNFLEMVLGNQKDKSKASPSASFQSSYITSNEIIGSDPSYSMDLPPATKIYDNYVEPYSNYNSQFQNLPFRSDIAPQQPQQYEIPSYSTQYRNFPNSNSAYLPQSYTSDQNIIKRQNIPGPNPYQNNYPRY